ncbi:MAG: YaeQ family protein [Gemmatimonadetes bacterium]|nr:YaeQ family protein [Gemmatimonadota bacterium]MBI3566996.1 YaeQ family protein [Gemmatimonadota bacterium]
MALTATMYTFDIDLSDVDRNVYESLALKVARHPSETEAYLLTRVLAYCLEYAEGIGFSKGLADPEDPPVAVRDLTGAITAWIEIGFPDAARVHKASKAAPRVAIYTHKEPRLLLRQWEGQRIHRAESVELYEVDRSLLADLATHLDRRVKLTLSVSDGQLYVDVGGRTLHGAVTRHPLVVPG